MSESPDAPRPARLVAISVVKDEADIIEAFVRHTAAWVDHHLVFDHDSRDGTRDILNGLVRDGIPLTLYTDDNLANLQEARSNALARRAAADFGAEWIVPLDADEVLCGPAPAALRDALSALDSAGPVSLPLWNYFTTTDDPAELNPILRLQHRGRSPSSTVKILLPRALALAANVRAGKGNHQVFRDDVPLAAHSLPDAFFLAHLAQRSPEQQALRIVLAELQKLSRGRAHEGLDLHYRLGFQLLAENPAFFFDLLQVAAARLRHQPIPYHGSPLTRTEARSAGGHRVIRALLPFLERLAESHGRLVDGALPPERSPSVLRPLPAASPRLPLEAPAAVRFSGFTPISGWEALEGPCPEAFLPTFHWGLQPATTLDIDAALRGTCELQAVALTYSDDQTLTIEVDGHAVATHQFERVNQLERINCPLRLEAGPHRINLHYSAAITSDRDPRRLAVIFLGLRIVALPS